MKTRKISPASHVIHGQVQFAECIERVEALSRAPHREDEGPALFLKSRKDLERDLDLLESGDPRKKKDSQVIRELANRHSLLALAGWLYPNSAQFDRKENAQRMLEHSTKACHYALSSSERDDEALSLGLFVQLRTLPYLIKSKLQPITALFQARRQAEDLIGRSESNSRRDLAGLLSDAMGFSFYLQEHDRKTAIHHADKAFDYLLSSRETGNNSLSSTLVSNMISVSLWDLGTFYESLAEEAEGAKSLDLFRKAGSKYSIALSLSKENKPTWCIYTAFSRYGLAGTLVREVELRRDDLSLKEKRKLAWKAFSLADKAFLELKKWSTREASIIAASTNSFFQQKLAELYKPGDPQNVELIRQSGQVTSKKELGTALNAGHLQDTTRYSAANLADISFRRAVFFHKRAMMNGARKSKDLLTSLEHCLESQKNFDVERHANRLVESLLLGAKICNDIVAQFANAQKISRSSNYYSRLGREQCQRSIDICQKLGWQDRLAEANEILGTFSS